ncbi:hypothetical protein ACHAXR_006867 [Thalassiosira sp. AJA248-18]
MTNDNILAQIGLCAEWRDGKTNVATADRNGDVALDALCHLITSGKVSVEDAKVAVQSARDAAAVVSITTNNNGNNAVGQSNNKKTNKNKSSGAGKQKNREQFRTRHVALQFSYDGTDFTGFAENIGKECDNSVEKALFAALEKTRLLVSPEENGMLVVANEDGKTKVVKRNDKADGENGGEDSKNNEQLSARTASKYSRCGRTDKGVHAHGQVVALYLKSAFPLLAQQVESDITGEVLLKEESLPKNSLDGLECLVPPKKSKGSGTAQSQSLQQKTITEYDYPRILNNILPPSIRVLGWCPVSSEFSARFSCSQRTYRYFFPRRNLDLPAMAKGLQYMMGRHDFRNLCKMNCEQVYNFERVLMSGKVVSPQMIYPVSMEENVQLSSPSVQEVYGASSMDSSPHDMCHVEIVGQAFLWHQIRCIMSLLFYVGRELESPMLIKQLFDIEANPAKPSYEMASETALVLQDCQFYHLNLGRTVRSMWSVTRVLEQRWENHAVAAERANDALESLKKETEVRWTDVMEYAAQIARDRRKKEQKRTKRVTSDDGEIRRALEKRAPATSMISWGSAVNVIQEVLGVYPHLPNGSSQGQKGLTESSVHVPLMERAKGTTYEEKVKSILGEGGGGTNGNIRKSSKRKERYEENIIKKRKTAEEDKAFYEHMSKQGGSSL